MYTMDHSIVPKLSITITQIKQLKVETKWTRKRQLIRVMIAGSVRRSDLGDRRPRPRLARPARGAGGAAGGADGQTGARPGPDPGEAGARHSLRGHQARHPGGIRPRLLSQAPAL